jgi:hypothetical protein
MRDYPKKIKRMLRLYNIEAYEIELHRELTKLEKSFEKWKNGTISNVEISYRIHQYEKGPSRELFKKYNYGEDAMNVAYAIVTGFLDREKIPVELLEEIEGALSFFQSMKERGELKEPGEE